MRLSNQRRHSSANATITRDANRGDSTQDANATLHEAFKEALEKMSPEAREYLVQMTRDATKAEESKEEQRWFWTRGLPGAFIMLMLNGAVAYFSDDLIKHNLGAVVWVALHMIWIPFWQYYIAHLPNEMVKARRLLQGLVFGIFPILTLFIVYCATKEKRYDYLKLQSPIDPAYVFLRGLKGLGTNFGFSLSHSWDFSQ